MSKKCFMCKSKVTNELICKDGNYFCGNDCEAEYWNKFGSKNNMLKNVRILENIPKFVGKELQVLGPYKNNDIAELPLEIADILIKKGRAEELNKLISKEKNIKYDLDTLKNEIFHDFYGYNNFKNALMLMLVSDKPFHIFIIGDPCSGKTLLLNKVAEVSKSKIITKISDLKKNKSKIIIIDDFDIHMLNDPREYFDIFNQGKSVLISMRPSFGRYDPFELIHTQVTLPRRMLNHFDLIFPIKDMPSKEKDYEIVTNFLTNKNHEIKKEIIDYIDSLKNKEVILTNEAIEEIRNYYVKMRNCDETDKDKPIPITLRQVEAIVKVSKLFAIYNHSDKITKDEAKEGIKLMHYILSQLGLDPETGKLDIDRIIAGIKIIETQKESTNSKVLETIKDLEDVIGENIHLSQIIEWCKSRNISESETRKALIQLKKSGSIFEPYENIFKKL